MTIHPSLASHEAHPAQEFHVASFRFQAIEGTPNMKQETWNSKLAGTRRTRLHASRITLCSLVMTLGLVLHVNALSAASPSLAERVVEHRLANGLTVLMVERHQTPVVSINITFAVGGINEQVGQTGLAHLYEHMAFKGTRTVGTTDYEKEKPILDELALVGTELDQRQRDMAAKGSHATAEERATIESLQKRFLDLQAQAAQYVIGNEMALLYQRHGGVGLNASTGKDLTRYMISLPSNRLPLWAAIESDRMANPVLREFYKERGVVMEERRLRNDDSPNGLLFETFTSAAFRAHSYGVPTIGWGSDILSLTPVATEAFFKTHYGPNRATIALVGDIDPKKTIALIEQTFGKIPAAPPSPPLVTVEPEQRGERRVEVEFDAEPALVIGYHKPTVDHPDDDVFDVIDAVLSDGLTSRLHQRLVREKRLAASVGSDGNHPGVRAPNLFVVTATPLAPHTTAEVETAIYEEIERLKREPVSAQELEKVLNNLDADLVRGLRSNSGLASQLALYQAVAGGWRYILTSRDQVAKVTAADVQRVAAQYFTKSNRTVAVLVKKGNPKAIVAMPVNEVKP
ncbi:putative Peptidase M16 [Candidatus Nitrospira nitrificans]|uniref:Putative Peptidase M16 n=2 Tax=Candidatus Nitrospira nitrificans TaxID=1742973 RepID=A0A0S4LTQ6_9BACT|nr:putative Peptidase M16 [Candidatus Nitrospira nitrificans]